MADYYTLPVWVQKLLPDADDELGHGFEKLVRAIVWQAVAASISRQVDCDECMRLLQHRGLEDVAPQQVRIGEAVDEDGYVAGTRGVDVRVDNIVDIDAGGRGEEGVSEAWERLAVETPVLLLGWSMSVASTVLMNRWQRTSLKLLLLFSRVCGLENTVLPRDSDPGEAEAEEAEAKLEDKPGQARQPATWLLRREGRRRRHRRWLLSCGCCDVVEE